MYSGHPGHRVNHDMSVLHQQKGEKKEGPIHAAKCYGCGELMKIEEMKEVEVEGEGLLKKVCPKCFNKLTGKKGPQLLNE